MAKKEVYLTLAAIIAVFLVITYFFSAIFLPVGLVLLVIGLVVGIMGMQNKSHETFLVGALLLILGIILTFFGVSGYALFKFWGILC